MSSVNEADKLVPVPIKDDPAFSVKFSDPAVTEVKKAPELVEYATL